MNKKEKRAILADLQKSIKGYPYESTALSGNKLIIFFKGEDTD